MRTYSLPLAASRAGLVSREVAVDHKEVNARLGGICDRPFKALCGVGEVAVFIEVEITGVSEAQGHARPPFMPEHQCMLLLMENGGAKEYRQLKGQPFERHEGCGISVWPKGYFLEGDLTRISILTSRSPANIHPTASVGTVFSSFPSRVAPAAHQGVGPASSG
jgi:hypothetical protein